jgi:hypothetical protein
MLTKVPFAAARYDPAIGQYRSALALQPGHDYKVQQATIGEGISTA